MDDQTFDDPKTAQEWISLVEKGQVRDTDINPRLKAWINQNTPNEILEIGCGQGICSDKIELSGRHYTGIEPSPYLVDRANELYHSENRQFLLGNAYKLPVAEDMFDSAFSVLVWHLLSDLRKANEELSRALKTGGHFLIITANPDAYPAWKDFYIDTRQEGQRFEGSMLMNDGTLSRDVLHFHTLGEITNSLQSAGLKVQETEIFRNSYLISIQGRKLV